MTSLHSQDCSPCQDIHPGNIYTVGKGPAQGVVVKISRILGEYYIEYRICGAFCGWNNFLFQVCGPNNFGGGLNFIIYFQLSLV